MRYLLGLLLVLSVVAQAAPGDNKPVRKPVLVSTPDYPNRAFRERIEGDVEVCFAILDDGSVYRPYVSSSTHRVFNRSALRAIRSSKFEADPSGERSIKACRKYQFRLQPIQST